MFVEWRRRHFALLVGIVFCALAATACDLITSPLDNIDFFASPTPPPRPTPVGNTLTYVVPRYSVELQPNQFVPGTTMQFIAKNGDNYSLKINGQSVESRVDNIWQWQGVIAPGVLGNYLLTLQRTNANDRLAASGQVTLTILEPAASEATLPQRPDTPLLFSGIELDEVVPEKVAIPGTSLVYETQQSDGQIQFSGTSNYPLTSLGNTVSWSGALRPNVFITNELQFIGIETHGLRTTGSAEIIIYTSLTP